MLRGSTPGPSKRARNPIAHAPGNEIACKLAVALVLAGVGLLSVHLSPVRAQTKADPQLPVTVAFMRHVVGHWTSRIADKSFDVATGRTMKWVAHDTDSTVAAALATGRADIGFIGVGVAAAAIGRGLDVKLILAMKTAPECEGLVVSTNLPFSPDDPHSLTRSVIAVPFGSTPHFRLLQSLKHWGASPAGLRLANLQATQIAHAWRRREIDAAAISEPMLGMLAADGRRVPLLARDVGTGLVLLAARADFVASHVVFLSRLIDLMTQPGGKHAASDAEHSVSADEIKAIALVSGLKPADIPAAVDLHQPPPIDEQLSQRWLGGGGSLVASRLKEALEVWRWAGRPGQAEADLSAAIALEPLQRARSYRH